MILRPVTPASPCGPPTTKRPVGIDEVLGLVVDHRLGDDAVDDLLLDVGAQLLVRDFCAVLRRDDDGVDANRPAGVVLDRHLRLAVGPEVVHHTVTPGAGQALPELVRQHDRHRHQLVGFRARVAEHEPLVACAAGVHAHRNVGRLPVDRGQHGTGFGVETIRRVGVADFLDGLADDLLEIDVAAGRDLTGDQRQARRDERLAGHAGSGVLREDGVENRVGNLVGDLVRVPFRDGLGRE